MAGRLLNIAKLPSDELLMYEFAQERGGVTKTIIMTLLQRLRGEEIPKKENECQLNLDSIN